MVRCCLYILLCLYSFHAEALEMEVGKTKMIRFPEGEKTANLPEGSHRLGAPERRTLENLCTQEGCRDDHSQPLW